MKRVIATTILMLVAPLAAAADVESAREEVRAAETAFAAAFAANDPEAFASLVAEDAVFMGGGRTLRGREAIVAVWAKMMAQQPFSWSPSRVEVNDAATLGVTTGPVRDRDGKHVGSFASTWERQADGSWQVIFDLAPDCPRAP